MQTRAFYMDNLRYEKGAMIGNMCVLFYGQTVTPHSVMGYCTSLPDRLRIDGKFYGSPALELSK